MKNLSKLAGPLLTAILLLPGCGLPLAGGPSPDDMQRYQAAVESWRGANIDEVFAAWPRSWLKERTTADDGSPVYAFIRQEQQFRQAEHYFDHAHNEWVEKTSAATELVVCETRFITDSQGVITAVSPGNYQCGRIAPPPSRP